MVSAANSNSESGTSASGARAPFNGTPVAHETAVLATGARTDDSGKRELFKENTTTALVFPNGGVIRLSAPAAPGQLLFLTNPQTRREVVAQVTRRRNNPGAGYYIELEFTEPARDFWGVTFPEAPAQPEATPSAPQTQVAEPALAPAAAEFLQPAEPGSDDLGPNAPAPSTEEVNALMEEVEALRAQLKSMQTQAATPSLPAVHLPAAQIPAPSAVPPTPGPAASAGDHAPSAQKAAAHDPDELDNTLLPKPALDFTKSTVAAPHSTAHAPVAPPSDSAGILRLALLAVVSLFAVMVAAWNMHLFPWLNPKSGSSATTAAQPAASAAKTDPHATTTDASATSASPTTASASQPTSSADSSAPPSSPTDSATGAVASRDHTAPLTPISKHSAVRDSKSADAISASSPNDGSITPPRLIKSVRAVAPGDALRQFMTGNVTLDALIDKTGEVKSMKVLSGPPSFHKAAMEALRQYRYEPARQNGKPVSAHLTVTIPFWFEP